MVAPMSTANDTFGVSGMSLYVPRFRVRLEDWCGWTGSPWEKVRAVVGRSFRMPGPRENVYTMAANAVLRLIDAHDVDPQRVGLLAFGTESSTDNSAGAVIIRGMIDRALEQSGRRRLARDLEVPELKHACLGGVYALKAALRYLRCDGRGRQAIVVCADIAEYERGTSGEPTQGAGAVAMLVEERPRLFTVDLSTAGSASDYRGPDFRKPFARHFLNGHRPAPQERPRDYPVFSGKYSTFAYLDETACAVDHLLSRRGSTPQGLFEEMRALFFHRPFHLMPVQGMGFLYARALARTEAGRADLEALCEKAGVAPGDVLAEVESKPDLFGRVLDGKPDAHPYPALHAVAGALRGSGPFEKLVQEKMGLGADVIRDLGNLYTASLPAWVAAGLEDAASRGTELAGAPMLMVGYGSGDAAEAMVASCAEGWRDAARRIGAERALEGAIDLNQEQYEALHDGREMVVEAPPSRGFVVGRVGDRNTATFQDLGVEYYDYVP